MAGWVDDLGDGVRKVIRAFHGSPYDFDKFDASKIGKGEGAQAYGHGLYFAGNEAVARSYRDIVGQEELTRHQEELRGLLNQKSQAAMALQEAEIGYKNAVRNKHITGKTQEQIDQEWLARIADARAAMNQSHLEARDAAPRRQRGHMYEVEIGYPEEALLDWDRPLRSQGAIVGERIAPFRTDKYDLGPDADYESGATAVERIASAFDSEMAEASAALRKAGIPGIKYWDAGSRSAHQGTRNYVIFPGAEDAIKIIRKYGWMLPVTMAAGAAVDGQPVNR